MFLSGAALVKSPTILQEFTPASWNGWPQPGITRAFRWGSYSEVYRAQLWVAVLVNKIANATARLPLKVYERDADGRNLVPDHPYSALIAKPSSTIDRFLFWVWVRSTIDIYGEAFLLKVRDRGGRPVELVPWHPTKMDDDDDGTWWLRTQRGRVQIARRDFVHFKTYNPDSLRRGMSPLEPLRATLENEEGARRANSAMWRNGARPSVVLKHKNVLSQGAQERLRLNWEQVYAGVDNWSKAVILEEGMEADMLTFEAKDLQYVEGRKLNREEACAIYDVPPPVVHILDRATFSNITEQMRSMYRDTMAPKLGFLESTLEFELRDGSFGDGDPDFGAEVYSEFLMDEVLRGDFEVRVGAIAQAINTGQLTPAEGRQMENRPFIEGSDRLFINGAVVPLEVAGAAAAPEMLTGEQVRSVMGRLSRVESLAEIDPAALVAGLNGHGRAVLVELERAQMADMTVGQFKDRLRALGGAS